jgi:zinc/manganese transport system substrate-binding protein
VVRALLRAIVLMSLAVAVAGCGRPSGPADPGPVSGRVQIVAAENQYANVAAQIGGRYVQTAAIERLPNTDPHTFEATVSVARELATNNLVIINGLG